MLGKYTTSIWNVLCIVLIVLALKLIVPWVQMQQVISEKTETPLPLKQIGTKRTLWKRGQMPCTTTIIENNSNLIWVDDFTHSTDDWMSITWSKSK